MDQSSLAQNRRSRRSPVLLTATIDVGGMPLAGKLRNLSEEGALALRAFLLLQEAHQLADREHAVEANSVLLAFAPFDDARGRWETRQADHHLGTDLKIAA